MESNQNFLKNKIYLESVANVSNKILRWDGGVIEVNFGRIGAFDAHLLLWRTIGNATEGSLNDKRSHLILGCSIFLHFWNFAKDSEDFGEATVGDPDFSAVEIVRLSVFGGSCSSLN